MVNLLDYKRAKQYLSRYPLMKRDLEIMFESLRKWEKDPTIRNVLDDLEQAILRLDRRADYEKHVLEGK